MKSSIRPMILVALAVLAGCASGPHRAYVDLDTAKAECRLSAAAKHAKVDDRPSQITPIRSPDGYTLHFLEFDDQGWAYANEDANDDHARPAHQIDCALDDLEHQVARGKVLALVYVHGWEHSAHGSDKNVARFQAMLTEQARSDPSRKVVGFYISWNGDRLKVPLLNYLEFPFRKRAAARVAEGSVQEFFARIKELRMRCNGSGHACGADGESIPPDPARLRTVMSGHSLGAMILYSSVMPYLLDAISNPDHRREQGIADLVLLLTPAFEASRYEPLHRAAARADARFTARPYRTPLVISLSSPADFATRRAFRAVQALSTAFHTTGSSEAAMMAMQRTHGYIDRYLTHRLNFDDLAPDASMTRADCLGSDHAETVRREFLERTLHGEGPKLRPGWIRQLCGGMVLTHRPHDLGPHSPVWNVQTDDVIISDHSDITGDQLHNFLSQIYVDLGLEQRGQQAAPHPEPRSRASALPTPIRAKALASRPTKPARVRAPTAEISSAAVQGSRRGL